MMDVNKKVYLAFINNYRLPYWKNLGKDLSSSLPVPYSFLSVEMELNVFYSADRNQYHSTYLLTHIINHLPEDGEKIVGITDVDIYIPILTFLFGEAQLQGKGALVSTHRLNNEFLGLPGDDTLLYSRTLKEILHELGHTFGLVHCQNYTCAMTSSSYVEGIDLKKARFCKPCQARANASLR
jgi:archaemetzincin